MVIEIGKNPWILITLIFAELLLILIPAIIASKLEKTSLKDELAFMGLKKNKDSIMQNFLKVVVGIVLGFIFFIISGYIAYFFRNLIIENIFGAEFVKNAQEGSISTEPIKYDPILIMIIIILQFILVAFCEETFFRGFIIKKIEKKASVVYGIFVSSLCFAFYHIPPFLVPIMTIITFFGYFFTFGLLLSIIFKASDNSLIPCIIAHGIFNTLIIIF